MGCGQYMGAGNQDARTVREHGSLAVELLEGHHRVTARVGVTASGNLGRRVIARIWLAGAEQ